MRRTQSVAWAWAVGWALASVGLVVSDVYSTPNSGFAAAYILGFAGWGIGTVGIIRDLRCRFDADVNVVALATAGWGAGGFVAVVLGFTWLNQWNLAYWGPLVAAAVGASIGGALTLPMRSASPGSAVLRASVTGALSWGAAFLTFQAFSFYAGYVLMQMTVDPLVPLVGHTGAKVPGWALPAGAAGYFAARVATRLTYGNVDTEAFAAHFGQ